MLIMKKWILVFVVALVSGVCYAQETESEEISSIPGAAFTFEEDVYNFGDIHQGDVVEHTFVFENSGDEPLIITNVKVTCGCTATDWSRDPIPPGEQSRLTVKFNSTGKMGQQNKVITIVSNATNPLAMVRIVTNVLPKEKDSE